MNKRRRRIQKRNRRLRKCEAAIQRTCRRTILNTLNGRATIPGEENLRSPRRLVMVTPNNDALVASLRATAGATVGVVVQGEAAHRAMTTHTTSLALRFDPSVNGQWLVTIEKNRWGRHGFSMRVALYAGQWFAV
jgi:hypothetical protein